MTKKIKKYLLYFLILVYVSGVIGVLVNPSFFLPFTPYTLILTSLVFLINQQLDKTRYLFGFLTITFAGFLLEVIGVKTGFIFGTYNYGNNLGYKVLSVPLVISLNWAVLISSGILIANKISDNAGVAALISAVSVTFIDGLIEPVASDMDLWYFTAGVAGFQNYFAWFAIAFTTSLLLKERLASRNVRIGYVVLGLQVIFFGVLNLYKLLTIS